MFLVLGQATWNEFKPQWGMTSEVWWVSKLKRTQRGSWRGLVGGRAAACAVQGEGPCCACPKDWALPSACVHSAVPIASKKDLLKWFYEPFTLSYSSCRVLLSLPSKFLPAPTHSVALTLPQGKVVSMLFSQVPINCLLLTRSECGLWVCRRNYSLSYFQLTMAAASLDKPSLNQLQGWAKHLDNEKNLWTGSWGNPIRSCRITEGLGFSSLFPCLWPEGKALMNWAKNTKIKGKCKGVCRSVKAWIA